MQFCLLSIRKLNFRWLQEKFQGEDYKVFWLASFVFSSYLFMQRHLRKQQQINKTKTVIVSTSLTGLSMCIPVKVHLLSHYKMDERRQMAFSCLLLTLYSSVMFRSISTSLPVRTNHSPYAVSLWSSSSSFR